jgi:hypothetical protein
VESIDSVLPVRDDDLESSVGSLRELPPRDEVRPEGRRLARRGASCFLLLPVSCILLSLLLPGCRRVCTVFFLGSFLGNSGNHLSFI